jgi:hypothetical protein
VHLEGWDKFWNCCRAVGSTRGAGNGVATFARQGLTLKAERDSLGDRILDETGRCLLTYHARFVLFNVYGTAQLLLTTTSLITRRPSPPPILQTLPLAPLLSPPVPNDGSCGKNGTRPMKMRFLRALRRRMQALRAEGHAVILAGDLNLKHRREDGHPEHRCVRVDKLLQYEPGVLRKAAAAAQAVQAAQVGGKGERGGAADASTVTLGGVDTDCVVLQGAPAYTCGAGLLMVAEFDFAPEHEDELGFREGDLIADQGAAADEGWWRGKLLRTGQVGAFPRAYVRRSAVAPPPTCAADVPDMARYFTELAELVSQLRKCWPAVKTMLATKVVETTSWSWQHFATKMLCTHCSPPVATTGGGSDHDQELEQQQGVYKVEAQG